MLTVPPALHDLHSTQQGLLTRRQLYAAGIGRAEIRWALGRVWQQVHPDVFATTTGRLEASQSLVAAQLFAGDDAQIGSTTAAAWFGITSVPRDDVLRLFVPWGRESRVRPGVAVRRTRRPDPRPWHRGPLTFTSPRRAVVDAARQARGDDVLAIVIEAVQRRLVTLEQLSDEVESGAIRGSAAVRRAVQVVSGGAWSMAEAEFADLLATSRLLPAPMLNPELRGGDGSLLPSPDCFFDDVGLAVQVHSRRHHFLEDDWQATLRSDTALGVAGVPVLAFSPHEIRSERSRVLRAVEQAWANLVAQGTRPDVVARSRAFA